MQEEKWKNYIIEWFEQQNPHLNFSINPRDKLNENGARGIANGMKEIGPKIKSLFMYVGPSKFKVDGSKSLGEALASQTNISQMHLDLQKNKLQAEGIKYIAQGVENIQMLQYLRIDISSNEIGSDGGRFLGLSLSTLQNLIKLNIRIDNNNKLESNGFIGLCDGIGKCTNLEELQLIIHECGFDSESVKGLKLLFSKTKKLENLQLILSHTQIYDQGAKYFKNIFSEIKQLKKIQLSLIDDSLTSQGWQNICEGFMENQNLEDFSIKTSYLSQSYNNFHNLGSQGLKSILKSCNSLRVVVLDLTRCKIDNECLKIIGEGLQQAENLQKLKVILYGNSYGRIGLEYFFKGIENLKLLNSLQFQQNQDQYNQFIGNQLFYSLQKMEQIRILNLTELYLDINSLCIPSFVTCFNSLPNIICLKLNLNYSQTLTKGDINNILDCFSQKKRLNSIQIHLPNCQDSDKIQDQYLLRQILKYHRIVQVQLRVNYTKIVFRK